MVSLHTSNRERDMEDRTESFVQGNDEIESATEVPWERLSHSIAEEESQEDPLTDGEPMEFPDDETESDPPIPPVTPNPAAPRLPASEQTSMIDQGGVLPQMNSPSVASLRKARAAPRAMQIPVATQATLPLSEPTLTVEESRILKHLATVFQSEIEVKTTRVLKRLVTVAAAKITELNQDLATSKEVLSSEIQAQVATLKESLTSTVESIQDQQGHLQQNSEMILTQAEERLAKVQQALEATGESTLSTLQMALQEASQLIQTRTQEAELNGVRLEKAARSLSLKLWTGPAIVSLAVLLFAILGLSALRPGWFLTPDQHEALYVGAQVVRDYNTANEEKKAEMRRILEWREPDEAPSPLIDQ